MLVVSGFKFLKHRTRSGVVRWFCGTHRKKGCGAYMYTAQSDVVRGNNKHFHERTPVWKM